MSAITATPPQSANDVKIEDAGPARKRLTITIPAEVIDEKLQESISTLGTETALPGFRKGKVPRALLEKRFGPAVRTETKNQLIANAYASAIEDHKLKPVTEPEPGEGLDKLELEQGKPLTFSLIVEVAPEFELPAFDSIEVKKPMLEITEQHIADELQRQQMLHGTAADVEGHLQKGDRILGYASVTREDEAEPFFRQDNVLVIHPGAEDGGRGQVLGLMIDDLAARLSGKNVGDTIIIDTVGPEAHEREDIRGKKLHMEFEIRTLQRVDPAAPDAVAERYGLAGEEMLREQIKLALEHRRDDEQSSAMREQAVDQLADKVSFDLPEKMSAQQAARALEQYRLELLYQGRTPEEVEEKLADVRGEAEEASKARLKRFFLLHRLGEHFKVEVSEQEVNGRIAAIAAQRGHRPEKLRAELAQAGRLGEVSRLIRDQKAGDRLVQQVKKTEISADDWNKIFKDKEAAKRSERGGQAKAQVAAKPEGEPRKKGPSKKK